MCICSNAKHFFVSVVHWNLILIQSEFYLSAAARKRYQCIQQDEQKAFGNSLPNVPSCARRSEKIRQAIKLELELN